MSFLNTFPTFSSLGLARVMVVQVAELWSNIPARKSSWFTLGEGSLVLFGTSFEVKDSGLSILTSLSKPALSIGVDLDQRVQKHVPCYIISRPPNEGTVAK